MILALSEYVQRSCRIPTVVVGEESIQTPAKLGKKSDIRADFRAAT